ADWRRIVVPATGSSDQACGPSKGTFQPIVGGHAHCSRCFPAPSTRRSSERTPRLRSPRKSVGFTCERVPSPSTPNHTLRPGSPPRTGFHLPPAAQSSIRPTACFRRRRCTDCATTAQRTSWRYYARLCGSPARFLRSHAPPSTHGPRRRRCGAAAGYWARDWVSRISASPCSTAAWRSRWAEPSSLCKTRLALPRRDAGGRIPLVNVSRKSPLRPANSCGAHRLLPLLGVNQFLQDLLVAPRPHVD